MAVVVSHWVPASPGVVAVTILLSWSSMYCKCIIYRFQSSDRLKCGLQALGRIRTPVREAFSYGIRHIHCDSVKYDLMLHWITMNMPYAVPYPVWICIPYGSTDPPYYSTKFPNVSMTGHGSACVVFCMKSYHTRVNLVTWYKYAQITICAICIQDILSSQKYCFQPSKW